ncbi:F-box/LRR-repeat protein At3g59190-like [Arachis ipaensis]|uniref:F-box/LRR-repeat protein At3g59190-like n=1 Tax=Arachis ipaensis TaxID=130454 RepID=UPI0007AEEC02|nr:F-box/LRR-repeat protein At3g59190-like [Arachis ipaensis]
MDQISSLPEIILHDILSRLPKQDAINTSLLSKTWREIFCTFPILSICDRESISWSSKRKKDRQIKRFLDYGKQRLLRFSEQGLAIKEFTLKLSLTCFDLQLIYPDVDQWLKLASECDLQTLKLCLPTLKKDDPCLCYILHPGVIEARSLNKLVLKGRIRFDKEFLNPSVKFSSLCVLSLSYVLFDDEGAIEHVISHSPLIERITLKRCYVYNPQGAGDMQISLMKSVSMHGLQNLKGVDIQGVQNVYIDAPNIEKLYYVADSYGPPKMNFDSCGNLRALTLMNMNIKFTFTATWFLHLSSKFPFLESLELVDCCMFKNIKISSSQLKALVLCCSTMEKIEIDTPNLLSFRYYYTGDNLPSISFLSCSNRLEVNVRLNMIQPRLYQLMKFVKQFKYSQKFSSLSLSIHPCFPSDSFYDDEYYYWEDPYSWPVASIKHLVIRSVRKVKSKYLLLVDRLFYSLCRKLFP